LRSTNGSNNGLRILDWSFSLDNQRLDIVGAFVISRMHHVLCHLGLTFYYFRKRRRVEESRVDELELGNLELDKMVLDQLEVGFDHD
nr:hypothetical protein [Tanacetum cinerariifolium]